MHEFRYAGFKQEVVFGAGRLAQLGELVERFGWRRLMLCTGGSQRRAGVVNRVEALLGEHLVAVFEGVRSHVPEEQVEEAAQIARELRVDSLIGLGGGSPLGLAKAVCHRLVADGDVAIIAIPTTYAGSEMTPVYGVTSVQADGVAVKKTVTDIRVVPELVLYDPLLTLDLPPNLTASTGVNALAHCIEALYSISRNPLSTAASLAGIRAMMHGLPLCFADGQDVEARTEMLSGAWLAGTALGHVAMALHHGICHVLGGTAGVAHGVANSIILPHALHFNVSACSEELALAAEAMGITPGNDVMASATEGIERVARLIGDLKLPRHLRDVGVREADLPPLARLALQSRAVQSNPRKIDDASQIEDILRAAW